MPSDLILSESLADIGDPEDSEWEKLPTTRHYGMYGMAKLCGLRSVKGLHGVAHDCDRIGDRGADDIPTPPPNPRL